MLSPVLKAQTRKTSWPHDILRGRRPDFFSSKFTFSQISFFNRNAHHLANNFSENTTKNKSTTMLADFVTFLRFHLIFYDSAIRIFNI